MDKELYSKMDFFKRFLKYCGIGLFAVSIVSIVKTGIDVMNMPEPFEDRVYTQEY